MKQLKCRCGSLVGNISNLLWNCSFGSGYNVVEIGRLGRSYFLVGNRTISYRKNRPFSSLGHAGSIPVFLMKVPKSGAVNIFRNVIAAVGVEAALWTPAE